MAKQKVDALLRRQAQRKVFNSLDKGTYHETLDIRKRITDLYSSMYVARYRKSCRFGQKRNYSYLKIDRADAKSQGWKRRSRDHIIRVSPFLAQRKLAWVFSEEE